MKTIIIVTGGFDPLHSGHIAYFKAAKEIGDILVVGLNSNEWLTRKKGQAFMPLEERLQIIENLKMVDHCITFNDDVGDATDAIIKVKSLYPNDKIVFANGGDRTDENIPEMRIPGVEFVFGVGGESKLNSSSSILAEWKAPITHRPWGYYRVLHETNGIKVKELVVNPHKSLSMQRHQHRDEYWVVEEGIASVVSIHHASECIAKISKHGEYRVIANDWHQLRNDTTLPLKIIEIQYGTECIEEDIERYA